MSAHRNRLARLLANIDQQLALAEEMATEPQDDGDLESTLELVLEFRDARRRMEAELSQLQ